MARAILLALLGACGACAFSATATRGSTRPCWARTDIKAVSAGPDIAGRRSDASVRGCTRADVTSAIAAAALALASSAASAAPTDLKGRLDSRGREFRTKRIEQKLTMACQPGKLCLKKPSGNLAPATQDAMKRIRVLYAYLDELEQKLFARKWDALGTYIGVFSRQEAAFVTLIDDVERGLEQPGAPGVVAPAPLAASPEAARLSGQRDSMQFEAQQVFLSLDELNRGVATKDPNRSEKAYVRLALAYDRFLKAADLYVKRYQCYCYCTTTPAPTTTTNSLTPPLRYEVYDPITSNEKFYENVPDSMLVYDLEAPPKVTDLVLVLRGPDKGRTGKLIGISGAVSKGIVKLDTNGAYREVKVIDLSDVAKRQAVDEGPVSPDWERLGIKNFEFLEGQVRTALRRRRDEDE